MIYLYSYLFIGFLTVLIACIIDKRTGGHLQIKDLGYAWLTFLFWPFVVHILIVKYLKIGKKLSEAWRKFINLEIY